MSKKDSPSPPAPPDPARVAEANARANAFTQFTPFGNVLFGSVNDQGEFVRDPSFENAVQIQESDFQRESRLLQEQLALGLLQGFDFNLPEGAEGLSSDRAQQVSDDVFQTNFDRLNPILEQQREQLEQRLADQGIPVGSEAFNREINRFEQSRGDSLNQLALQSTLAGSQEASRLFGNQEAQRRNRLQEIASLLGAQTLGGVNLNANIPQTDIAGLTAQNLNAQTNAFNQQVAARNSQNQLLGRLAGAGLGFAIGGPFGAATGASLGGAGGGAL